MPRGSKDKYTDKQQRKAEHIEEGYMERGVSRDEAVVGDPHIGSPMRDGRRVAAGDRVNLTTIVDARPTRVDGNGVSIAVRGFRNDETGIVDDIEVITPNRRPHVIRGDIPYSASIDD